MLTLSLTKAIIGAYGYSAGGNNSRPHSLAAVDDYRRHIYAILAEKNYSALAARNPAAKELSISGCQSVSGLSVVPKFRSPYKPFCFTESVRIIVL